MAIIRDSPNLENEINYVATIAFFCGISCTILMLKFRGFKAILNLSDPIKDTSIPTVSSSGAYRTNKEEFFGYGSSNDPSKTIRPSMVKLPKNKAEPSLRPSKSTSDLKTNNNASTHMNKSTSEVSLHPRGPSAVEPVQTHNPTLNAKELKKQEKEQKKLEKKRIADQKLRDKMALEQAKKQEKLKKEREKLEAKSKPNKKEKTRKSEPEPKAKSKVTRQQLPNRNSAESNINNSAGPPPYTEAPPQEVLKNEKDNTGNTSFSKPIDNSVSSWDMISQHREQINRPVSSGAGVSNRKQKVMDLQYNFGNNSDDKDNSEA